MPGKPSLDPNQRIVYAVGAFVLHTQELERLFKYLVPMMNADDPSVGAILRRGAATARQTLGAVASRFIDASTSDSDAFGAFVRQVVTERNEVVHHFNEHFGPAIASGNPEEALALLRQRHERVLALIQSLREVALHVTEALRDRVFSGTAQYDEMDGLCRLLRASIEK
jgi:hypothetical protein